MRQVNRHIISNLNWSTTFDRKERASELQSRLSTWSNLRLQRELNDIFDALCPPGQTWRINSLELDLGTIEYGELEPELSLRVRKQLVEKLTEMINYPTRHGRSDLEILDEVTSRLSLLESFLLSGIMPWNGSWPQERADSMMAYQLKHHRSATVEMLWETGAKQEQVRQRMAWQFSDPVVIEIIRGLEPNNHEPIIEFSDRVTEIQRKESIVPGSVSELRKNIWHWVLNYLYNERGTVFNKIAFMRSTIMQMAAHHNVHYKELLELIERAVKKIKGNSSSISDFVYTLDRLSEEHRNAENKILAAQEPEIDYWYRLEVLLRDPSLRRSEASNTELNDLVVSLGRSDKRRMAEVVRAIANKESLRVAAVTDLNEFSLEVIFSALLPAASPPLMRSITLLNTLGREKNVWREEKILWNAALKFAVENRNATSDVEVFITYCVSTIAQETGKQVSDIFDRLMSVRIPAPAKTISSLEAYLHMVTVAAMNGESAHAVSFPAELKKLIALLSENLSPAISAEDRKAFLYLKAALLRKIKLHPKAALEILITYPKKHALRKVLSFLAGESLAETLLHHSRQEFRTVISRLKHAATLNDNSTGAAVEEFITQHIHTWALEAILLQPGITPLRFTIYLLQQLWVECGTTHAPAFILLCNELLKQDNPVMKEAGKILISDHRRAAKLPVTVQVKQFMHGPGKSQRAAGKLLVAHFADGTFTTWRRSAQKGTAELLNFLLPQGEKWMKTLVAEYKALLSAQIRISDKEIETVLKELFWKCVVDYEVHGGNPAVLRRLFHNAIRYQFSLEEKEPGLPVKKRENTTLTNGQPKEKISASRITDGSASSSKRESEKAGAVKDENDLSTEKQYALQNGEVITLRKLFILIAACLQQAEAEPVIEGKKYELKELLELGLELKPSEIRNIIARTPLTEARLRILKTASSFPQLSLWVMSDLRGEMNAGMEAVRMLHDLVARVVPGTATEKFLDQFWMEAWAIITCGLWSRDDLKKLIRTTFTKMGAELGVSAGTFITEMKNKNIRITPLLRDNLVACFPAFAALEENKRESLAGRKLSGYENRGLLDTLIEHLVADQRIPLWLGDADDNDVQSLLHEIIVHYPVKFLQVMKRAVISEAQVKWLSTTISFTELIRSVSDLHPEKRATLAMLAEFHAAIGKIRAGGISTTLIREIIFRKLLKAWTGSNWKIVAIENIWNEIIWDVCLKHSIPKKDFLREMERASGLFSPAIKIELEKIMERGPDGKRTKPAPTPAAASKKKKAPTENKIAMILKPEGIAVRNAGIVLLSTYVQMLFERLGLTKNKQFVSLTAQEDAVHYLQYVVTGLSQTEEHFLPLNKVLCGLPIAHPVRDGITLTDEQKNLINGLVKAAISHWPAIGDTSIEGFRGNWLVREGTLTEYPDRWELLVEKRAYDILMNKSPYSFSITKYPWMEKPLNVTWPY